MGPGYWDAMGKVCGRLSMGNGVEGDHDAARRVATFFEKWENRF